MLKTILFPDDFCRNENNGEKLDDRFHFLILKV